jgi:hypothetical protein
MQTSSKQLMVVLCAGLGVLLIPPVFADGQKKPAASSAPGITISADFPAELNPPYNAGPPQTGGAPNATPTQAALFAWQEFIALNWAAGPQSGQQGQRDTPSATCRFGDPKCTGPTTWQTFRGKVETFPGTGNPPGFVANAKASYGYDALPQYNYAVSVPACDASQASDPVPWVNLDETDQITLNSMYAGVVQSASSPGNSAPQLIRFLAKSNRLQYTYVAENSDPNSPLSQWWSAIPNAVVMATKQYLAANQRSPSPGSSTMVSQYNGTTEVKAAWRPLNPKEASSGRFHTQPVRFYERGAQQGSFCYRDATWGLVALHIIQKTASAPYFIYATFEQADNLLSAGGTPVEDADGNIKSPAPTTATTPQVCLNDPQPPVTTTPNETPSTLGSVILTGNPATCQAMQQQTYCANPGSELYYRNTAFAPPNNAPSGGNICVNKRDNAIPPEVIAANVQAHAAIAAYLKQNGIASAPWLAYKLVNVQYFPHDKVITTPTPNGSLYNGQPPYTAQNPSPSSFYQANIVVETNRALQLFSGGLSPNISTDWNQDGTQHKNTYYAGAHYDMGGCMGCHGSQGQNPQGQAGDFSVILARGSVVTPEIPAVESGGSLTRVPRNRSLSR